MKRLSILLIIAGYIGAAEVPTLVWSDEFDTPGAPDPAKWGYEVGRLRNNEEQFYTKDRRENARVEDGHLFLEARKEEWGKSSYTSASLTTSETFPFQYGRVEVRAKIPTGRGLWPAIWLLGSNIHTAGWPTCGEIDIMENVGFDPDILHATIHTKAYNHSLNTHKSGKIELARPWEDFHTYALDWHPDRLDLWVDERKTFTYANDGTGTASWPFDLKMYLILNVAVGGSWGGAKGVDAAVFPQRMVIDFVRIYQFGKRE